MKRWIPWLCAWTIGLGTWLPSGPAVAGDAPDIFARLIFIRDLYDRLTPEEQDALKMYRKGKHIDARFKAETILLHSPDSMVAHFVKAYALQHAEGELIRGLHHLRKSMALFQAQVGKVPSFTHHVLLYELFKSLRQLGREKECLKLIALHDRLYSKIKLEDLRPWVLMKMRRYKEARALATRYLKQGRYVMSALNALCAINFEENHRKQSLKYCRQAYQTDLKKNKKAHNRSVHLINLAEAHLSVFDLSLAEKYALGATQYFHRFLHSTPWEFLVGMYLDLGRYNDAWNALRQSRSWYLRQAPRLSESVYAGNQMTQSVFFLAMGQPKVSLKILERIRDRPDRRGHMSADTRQFVVGERLLRREARRMMAQKLRERAAAKGLGERIKAWFHSAWLRFLAWRDGASVRRHLADGRFLQRCLSPYRSGSFSMPNSAIPYWMVGGIIPLTGPAIVKDALSSLRQRELKQTPRIRPFLLAVEAEVLFRQGRAGEARKVIQHALRQLSTRLTPLRGRLLVLDGELARRAGDYKSMRLSFGRVLRKNGAVFRFLQVPLPLSKINAVGAGASQISKMLLRSPRFTLHYGGFPMQIREVPPYIQASIVDRFGSVLHRLHLAPKKKEQRQAFLERFAIDFQNGLFSPHFRLSRRDIFSLDDSLLRSSAGPLPIKKFDDKKSDDKKSAPPPRK